MLRTDLLPECFIMPVLRGYNFDVILSFNKLVITESKNMKIKD